MSATDQKTPRPNDARARYVPPTILSSATFEAYALACTGPAGRGSAACAVGVKTGPSNGCTGCTAGS